MTADILIVDDEADIRGMLQGILQDEGFATRMAAHSAQAYSQIETKIPDLVILDIWLQNSEHDGLQILQTLKTQHPQVPVLMISGHGTIETAVSAIKQGAYDFIEKPFKTDRLILLIQRALESARLKQENQILRKRAEGPSELVGQSHAMVQLRQALERVAQTNSRVILNGEAGTGKDLAARAIHRLSVRANGPFLSVNCAILRPERLEVELFGQDGDCIGVLERAHGGTLLLDEVSDMPLETQGKIVRALQEQKFQRVGGRDFIETDVRILASTNRNLQPLIAEGKFREDLFYRLNVVPITMPALRERPGDIPDLARFIVQSISTQSGILPCSFSEASLAIMQAYQWPGNVRQLKNVIESVMIMGTHDSNRVVEPQHLPAEINPAAAPKSQGGGAGESEAVSAGMLTLSLREAREMFERDYFLSQLRRFGGHISKTAQFVGMERSAFHRKLKQLGITDPGRQTDPVSPADGEEGRVVHLHRP